MEDSVAEAIQAAKGYACYWLESRGGLKNVSRDGLPWNRSKFNSQWWSCFVSDIQSNSGGAALSVTSNDCGVE